MAIKITKAGQKEFHGFCKWCGCEFTYEISDLKLSATGDKLDCPTCGKTYHHNMMVQDPTIPGGIGRLQTWPPDPIPCTPDMTKSDPCAGCTWRENLLRDGLYIGDTPCTWCNKNRFNTIAGISDKVSVKDYTTPCTTGLDTYLTTSTSSEINGTSMYATAYNCADGADRTEALAQGTVMQTLLGACNNAVSSDSCNCGDTESKSCSGEHKCNGNKNCKGKH